MTYLRDPVVLLCLKKPTSLSLISCFLATLHPSCAVAGKSKDRDSVFVVVEGTGETESAARDHALMRAVEKALGAEVFASSKLQDGVFHEAIYTLAPGHVRDSEVLSCTKRQDGAWQVRLMADVRPGMFVEAVRASPQWASRVVVPDASRWRDEAMTIRRMNGDAQEFADLILRAGEEASFHPELSTPQRIAIHTDGVVLHSECRLAWEWARWDRSFVRPMKRLLTSLSAPRATWRGTMTEHLKLNPRTGDWTMRRWVGKLEVESRFLPILFVEDGGGSEIYFAPRGISMAICGVGAGRTIPNRNANLVLECLDKDGNVLCRQSQSLPPIRVLVGDSGISGAAVIGVECFVNATEGFMQFGDLQSAGDSGWKVGFFDKVQDVKFDWYWKMNEAQLLQFHEARARVEWL